MRYRCLSYRYAMVVQSGQRWPFGDIWQSDRLRFLVQTRWRPDADAYETTSTVEIIVDLAGVDEEDFEVQLFENVLVVEGRRRLPSCDDTIPGPLRDRMEILVLSGYTDEEKIGIAREYLIPKQLAAHGLAKDELSFEPDAVRQIVRGYTREAGVRNLEREIAAVARKVARRLAEGQRESVRITDPKLFEGKTIHVHVPAGAIPKDGPSAGVTIMTALASLATRRPVRSEVAMTGEITLRGKVLPVGRIKEKMLAAHRAGIRSVILPSRNERDIEDVPEELRRQLRFIFVDDAEEVLRHALTSSPSDARRAA